MNEIKQKIIKEIKKVYPLILEEYGKAIPDYIKHDHSQLTDLNDAVHIEETGTISLFVLGNHFYFPKSAEQIFDLMKFLPGYGMLKSHKCYKKQNLIENKNTFITYMQHLFIGGKTVEDYYLENVLHETMHFCGSTGGAALEEGFTELKARELALKYNLLTTGCGYPKEIKIALELQKIFGKEICDVLTFMFENDLKRKYLEEMLGEEEANLYEMVSLEMKNEFYDKYMKYDFPGITGPLKKVLKYNNLDYSNAEELIKEYHLKKSNDHIK